MKEKKTIVIAEIGSNHNQSFELACETIDAAVECGADIVKFQSINIDKLYYNPSDLTRNLHKKIDFKESWHESLKNYCDKKNIVFMSTPTYFESVDILEKINVQYYKLASAQIGTFPQLVEKVAKLHKKVFLSTGIVTVNELDRAIEIFKREGNLDFTILHCNSIYPVPYEKVNLGMIDFYKKRYGCNVGFSDHTEGIEASISAVSMGASVIEKHFTLSKKLPVPDSSISVEPDSFKKMVSSIRNVEKMVQFKDRFSIEPEEFIFKKSILYRLFMKKEKNAGEELQNGDFNYLRYVSGVDARDEHLVVGKKLVKNIKEGELLFPDFYGEKNGK